MNKISSNNSGHINNKNITLRSNSIIKTLSVKFIKKVQSCWAQKSKHTEKDDMAEQKIWCLLFANDTSQVQIKFRTVIVMAIE